MSAPVPAAATAAPTFRQHLRAAVEPWYHWGRVNVERMDEAAGDTFGSEGEVRFFDLQCGLHVGFQVGRTPRRGGRA